MRFHSALLALALSSLLPLAPAFAQDHATHSETSDVVRAGDIEISGAFTRATLPNAPVAGGFLTLTNTGTADDRLVSAETGIARQTQIHEMAMEGDVMKMRPLSDGVVVPAGQSVTLEPGGIHLMFMGLNAPVTEGQHVEVTLTFETAGTAVVDLVAGGTAADAPAGHAGH